MEADIVESIPFMHQSRQNMLTCVVLHKAEPSLPGDLKANRLTNSKRRRPVRGTADGMRDHAVSDLHISHCQHLIFAIRAVYGTDPPGIRGLPAPFGEKHCPVQDYLILHRSGFLTVFLSGSGRLTAACVCAAYFQDRGCALCQICICIV